MIKPHGADELKPLFVYDTEQHHTLNKEAESLPSLLVSSAAAANAVMLGAGYFTPLTGFMNLADSLAVAENLHTTDGLFWPVPIINLTDDASVIGDARRIALRDPNVEGNPVLAIMDVEAIEQVSDEQLDFMAEHVFGNLDANHPGVAALGGGEPDGCHRQGTGYVHRRPGLLHETADIQCRFTGFLCRLFFKKRCICL